MAERRFLTAHWRHLLVLNYEVDPALVAARVPAGTQLDLDTGRCLVSLVAFRFERTRLLGVPVPFHTTFPEINLRFYVRREADDGVRRGVVFLRELVNRRAVAAAANWAYNENYRCVPIRAELTLAEDQIAPSGTVRYTWRGGGRTHHVAARRGDVWRGDAWRQLDPSSHEAFIAEHYFGYGTARDGRTIEYHVDHPPWRYAGVRDVEVDVDWGKLYGPAFATAFHRPPYSAFLLDGSPVTVYRPHYFRAEKLDSSGECHRDEQPTRPIAVSAPGHAAPCPSKAN